MVFGIFNHLKRKFFSIEDSNEFNSNVTESSGSPAKRVRVEELTNEGQPFNYVPGPNACPEEEEEEEEEVSFEVIPRNNKGKEKERIEELEEEVRGAREMAARLAQETREYVSSIDRTMSCVVCFDFIRNPQVMLECGHTACYGCLRSWFTRATERPNAAPMISTDEESEGNAEEAQPRPCNPLPSPARLRHRFRSAVNRKKTCPECQAVVTHRPLPLYRLRHLGDVMSGSESPVPSFLQPRRKPHQLPKRKDLWHGIFNPHNEPKLDKYLLVVENPGPVADEGPDPILEHWAQAQARRDAQPERVRWQAAIDEAREEGRKQVIREQRLEEQRLEEQRRRQSFNSLGFRFENPFFRERDDQRRILQPYMFGRAGRNRIVPQEEDTAPLHPAPASTPIPSLVSQPTILPAPPPSSRIQRPAQLPEFIQGPSTPVQLPARPVFLGPPPSEAGPSHSSHSAVDTQPKVTTLERQPPPPPVLCPPVEDLTPSTSRSTNHDPAILEAIRKIRQQYNNPQPSSQEIAEDADELDDEGTDLSLFQAMFRKPPPPQPSATEEERLYPVYAEELDLADPLQPGPQPQMDLPVIIFEDGALAPAEEDYEEEEDEDPEERLARLVREGEADDIVD